ncbi:homoserine dehydrogenase [Clostridium acetireducens DSM 10703]|jgi:homoserine dehydrogenase|uniref:Homoserine dehydrogenase n=1 Tax=Clostridium acetireducens DSM 10703 TaxID=1121290 RepID=A0A1E8F1X9_9CLOT|nr:homoserine dehydrogenase [Clostridium acetireducens]OFI07660.1 homoserine dehydrogenase [Clostridium acetireducens DSM 10703]
MTSIAVLGYGVVGTGVAELAMRNKEKIKKSLGDDLVISKILVRDLNKHLNKGNSNLLTKNIDDIFNDNVDIVVEVMGGINPAYEYIKQALKLKKHVVTANKDLIAEHGVELLNIAKSNGVTLKFEASVGGGIPVIKPLSECLVGNDINSIKAILNGTTNFILSKMYSENLDYDTALKLAQENGFAEANPESDVCGYDAARKLAILSTIAYNKNIDWKNINTIGITDIDKIDFEYAKKIGCNIKLLGLSQQYDNEKIFASVQPVMVKDCLKLSNIENEFNSIVIDGDAVGEVIFYGKGAGMLPTASSVFGDILDIIKNKNEAPLTFNSEKADLKNSWDYKSKWFLRIDSPNRYDAISLLADKFINCYIITNNLNDSNEIFAVVTANNEKELDDNLNFILQSCNAKKYKKMMIMGNN